MVRFYVYVFPVRASFVSRIVSWTALTRCLKEWKRWDKTQVLITGVRQSSNYSTHGGSKWKSQAKAGAFGKILEVIWGYMWVYVAYTGDWRSHAEIHVVMRAALS